MMLASMLFVGYNKVQTSSHVNIIAHDFFSCNALSKFICFLHFEYQLRFGYQHIPHLLQFFRELLRGQEAGLV